MTANMATNVAIASVTRSLAMGRPPNGAHERNLSFFFFQAEDGIRDLTVTGVQTCALPICESVDLGCALRGGGAAVAGSGSEDRGESYARVTFATVSHVRVVTSLPNAFSSSTVKTGPLGVGI